eukprot:447585_1
MGNCFRSESANNPNNRLLLQHTDINEYRSIDKSTDLNILKQKCLYLIEAYMRQYCMYFIHEINEICAQYLDERAAYHLIYFVDHNHWFENNIKPKVDIFQYTRQSLYDLSLNFAPLTQYIDNKYQIVFCLIAGGRGKMWRGFLCVNMKTNQLYQLQLTTNAKNTFHLSLSNSLKLTDISDFNVNGVGGKNTSNDIQQNCKYTIWKGFQEGLWDSFISNLLYDKRKNIVDQQIWRIIQFLSMLYFQKEMMQLVVPDVILSRNDKQRCCAGFGDDKYCKGKITEYKKHKILKCECYLYVDWGHHWCGQNKNLYFVKFELRKIGRIKKEINMKLEFLNHVKDEYSFL